MSFDELLKIPSESQFDIMSFYGSKVNEDEGDDNYKICSLANESGTGEFAIYKVLSGIRVVYNDINMLIGWHQEYQWMQMNKWQKMQSIYSAQKIYQTLKNNINI